MKTRIIAGLIAAALLTTLIFAGPYFLILLVILGCAMLAYLEYDRLFFPVKSLKRQLRVLSLIGLTIVAFHVNPASVYIYLWLCFVLHCVSFVVTANNDGDVVSAVRNLSTELLGYVYVVSLFGFLMPIVNSGEYGREYLFLLFVLVFMGDTAALFVGKYFGKHLLAPKISPKKTVEGSVGAVMAVFVAAAIWVFLITKHDTAGGYALKVLLFSPLASMLAQFGDLFESLLKRSQSQKDSGSFLPGHGGILDRVDGLALCAPVFFFYLIFVLEST